MRLMMIRVILGLLIVFGSVGAMDFDPDASTLLYSFSAGVGLGLMVWGVISGKNFNG